MAVDLRELVDSLRVKLNTPGDSSSLFTFTGAEEDWALALANGFWTLYNRGFFGDYRVDAEDLTITNTTGGDDLIREDQQAIVLQTGLDAIRSKMINLFIITRDHAGPVETERQRSSTLLRSLHDSLVTELENLRSEVINGNGTSVRVFDSILVRSGYCGPPSATWVR